MQGQVPAQLLSKRLVIESDLHELHPDLPAELHERQLLWHAA